MRKILIFGAGGMLGMETELMLRYFAPADVLPAMLKNDIIF